VKMAWEVEGDSEEEEEVQGGAITSDEEMEDDIKRAQAAVDECYHRRARWAGISIKATEDRLLTEEELDSLREQLGDGAGTRAKRRKEIEKMSITKMEVEIEEVQKKTFLCLTGNVAEGFTAYDGSNRSNIVESYSLLERDVCANMGKEGEVETMVYKEIVQIKQDRMIPVFGCLVIETIVIVGTFWQLVLQDIFDSESQRHWKHGNAVRQGGTEKSSSTAGLFTPKLVRRPLTPCSLAAGWTTRGWGHQFP
jgi:hypothetical protein